MRKFSCVAYVPPKPFGRRAERNVVEQRLRRRADHRDDLGARLGGGDGGSAVLVDVAAGDDHVQQRGFGLRQPGEQGLTLAPRRVEPRQAGVDVRAQRRAQRGRRRAGRVGQALAAGDRQGDFLRAASGLGDRRAQRPGDPRSGRRQRIDQAVRQRDSVVVDAVDPTEPRDGALDADRRVAGDEVFDGIDDRAGEAARPVDLVPVDPQFHGRPEGSGPGAAVPPAKRSAPARGLARDRRSAEKVRYRTTVVL